MKQAEILKRLLADYRLKGGDLSNVAAATIYLNTHKPPGVGHVNEVICGAIVMQMGTSETPVEKTTKAMLDTPPAAIEPAPVVIASKTVTLPEVMPQKPIAVYFEAPPSLPEPEYAYGEPPLPPVPLDPPKPVEQKRPDPVEVTATAAVVSKSHWTDRLKFWKKKK